MDWETAKNKVNPDPNWHPVRDSKEHNEIIALMKSNGYRTIDEEIRGAPRIVSVNTKTMKNPITREKPFYSDKKTISKNEFLSHPSNHSAYTNHINQNTSNSANMQRPLSLAPETPRVILDLSGVVLDKTKRISKHEFMKLGNVKEYVDNHILQNK